MEDLITGISGQMKLSSEYLLSLGYEVHGIFAATLQRIRMLASSNWMSLHTMVIWQMNCHWFVSCRRFNLTRSTILLRWVTFALARTCLLHYQDKQSWCSQYAWVGTTNLSSSSIRQVLLRCLATLSMRMDVRDHSYAPVSPGCSRSCVQSCSPLSRCLQ